MVFLEGISKLLLFLHAGTAIALIGAAVHLGIVATRHYRDLHPKPRVYRRYVKIVFWLYLVTLLIGLLVYPAFRVYVRGHYFDTEVPLATGFFELKEHWIGMGLGLLLWLLPMSRATDLRERGRDAKVIDFASVLIMVAVLTASSIGLVLTMIKSV